MIVVKKQIPIPAFCLGSGSELELDLIKKGWLERNGECIIDIDFNFVKRSVFDTTYQILTQ